jgi:hypothetical protein
MNERAWFAMHISDRAKSWAKAIQDSERASKIRAALEPGASRARITSANAKWSTAAEHRDRCEANLVRALEQAGFTRWV